MIAQQVAAKAIRDALFLSAFGASSLPYVMAAGAILSLAIVVVLSRLIPRYTPARVLPVLFALTAAGFALAWGLGFYSTEASVIFVYLHSVIFGPAVITAFWSLINERFDPHAAKGVVGRIAAGGTLGGIIGALVALAVSRFVEPQTLLLLLVALGALCVAGTFFIRVEKNEAALAPALESSPLAALRTSSFLRNIALLVGVVSIVSALLDYIFSAQAVETFGKGQSLVSFFLLFGLGVGVASFLFQVVAGEPALKKLGVGWSMAILPLVLIAGGAAGMLLPVLAIITVLRGADMVQRNTLFRSAYELLYAPLSPEQKRSTKALIDVGIDRFGTIAGSGVVYIALAIFAEPMLELIAAVILLAIATLWLTRRLQRGYVDALEEGLVQRARDLQDDLRAESEVVARDELIERVEEMRPGGLSAIVKNGIDDHALPCVPINGGMLECYDTDLLSGDFERVRRGLQNWPPKSTPFAGFAILLLAHKELHRDAQNALRSVGRFVTGQLIDALLDPATDFIARRRVPRVLASVPTQRAADGLIEGLGDARFEVRYECASALTRICAHNSELVLPREKLIAAIHRECDERNAPARAPGVFDEEKGEQESNPLLEVLLRDRSDRSLEHIFTLLYLLLEREPLRAAFKALHHDDDHHRGTALEYLATVLPNEVHGAVWPLLGEGAELPQAQAAKKVLEQVVRSRIE